VNETLKYNKMIIQNMLNGRLVFNHFWKKCVLCQRNRLFSAQRLRRLRDTSDNEHNAHRAQVCVKSLFYDSTIIPSWKWLLAISVVFHGNDSESKKKVILHFVWDLAFSAKLHINCSIIQKLLIFQLRWYFESLLKKVKMKFNLIILK